MNAPVIPEMKSVAVTQRIGEFSEWEPIYIGTHLEPLFDERLSWEGHNDKRVQVMSSCLYTRNIKRNLMPSFYVLCIVHL